MLKKNLLKLAKKRCDYLSRTSPFQIFYCDYSLNRLLPRVVESNRTVLEFLTYNLDLLIVLLAIFPLLYVVDTVAVSALELLHGCAVNSVHELN